MPCRAAALQVHTPCFCSHWRLPWCLGHWPGCFGWKYPLARCLVSWPMLARFVPRAVFGLGQGQLRPSWPAGPRPGAGQGRRCPQCPQCAHSSNSSGPHHPSHNHARGWQGMCAGLLGDTWRGTQWLAAAISLCRSIACMASFPAHHRWPQGASFRTRYPKRALLKGGFSPGRARGGYSRGPAQLTPVE